MTPSPGIVQRGRPLGCRPVVDDAGFRVGADGCEFEPGTVIEPFCVVHDMMSFRAHAIDDRCGVPTVPRDRCAADVIFTELPSGAADGEDASETAAKGGVSEEAGHIAKRWWHVGRFFAHPARQTNLVHPFPAEDGHLAGHQYLDDSEQGTGSFGSQAAVDEAVPCGEFSQSFHVASPYRARHLLRTRGDRPRSPGSAP